jgi:hypothetical protein
VLHFYAITANRCFGCGNDTHYLCDCPERARGTPPPQNKRIHGPGALSWKNYAQAPQPTHPPPNQFFPIVGAMYPPPGLSFPPPQYAGYPNTPPFPYPGQANRQLAANSPSNGCPADNFRPNYNQSQHQSSQQHNNRLAGSQS